MVVRGLLLTVLIFISSLLYSIQAATFSSNGNGDWRTGSTWNGGVPTNGASTANMNIIRINAGHTVTISGDAISLTNVVVLVYGTLKLDFTGLSYGKLTLNGAGSGLIVYPGGTLDEDAIFGGNLEVVVNGVTVWNGGSGDFTATTRRTFPSSGVWDPLPIELVSWSVESLGEKCQAKWVTASELNNSFFTIEESVDGEDFYEAAIVSAIGNSNNKQVYSHSFHSKSQEGLLYYRLKQTDLDGKFTYSAVVEVHHFQSFEQLQIFPNPVTGNEVTIANSRANNIVNISLHNPQTGQAIAISDFSNVNTSSLINLTLPESLVGGVYLLMVQYSDRTETKLLVVKR